jgi:hypothetical protein
MDFKKKIYVIGVLDDPLDHMLETKGLNLKTPELAKFTAPGLEYQ